MASNASESTNSDTDSDCARDTFTPSRDLEAAQRGRSFLAIQAAQNGTSPPDVTDEEAANVGKLFSNAMSATKASAQRRKSAGDIGSSHGGDRNIWQTLGYPDSEDVSAKEYEKRYKRQDIARAIINAPVETTWRETPKIRDRTGEKETDTDFYDDIQDLVDGEYLDRGLLNYCEWADRRQRIGEYGLIFLGFDDGRSMDQPVNPEELEGPEDLRYIVPISQSHVDDWELAGDNQSKPLSVDGVEFMELNAEDDDDDAEETPDEAGVDDQEPGKPKTYEIEFEVSTAKKTDEETEVKEIHHSRVVHVVEQPESSIIKHTPILQPVLNRLIDLQKVVGASAEMYWSSADRKYFASAEGTTADPEDIQRFDDQMYEMVNGMRTTAYGENLDLEVIDGQSVDPSGIVKTLLQQIAAVVGIPMRKLVGTERGDLASSMDQSTWFGKIAERQHQFAEPVIIRSIIDRLIKYGVISSPYEGTYTVEWPNLFELDKEEKSGVHKDEAQALKYAEDAIALGAPREAIYKRLGYSEDEIEDSQAASPSSDVVSQIDEFNREVRSQFDGLRQTASRRTGTATESGGGATTVNATLYDTGDVVSTGDDTGVVAAVLTEEFEFPVGSDETVKVDASSDTPAYVVGLKAGGSAVYRAGSLSPSEFDGDDPARTNGMLGNKVTPIVDESPDAFDYADDWTRTSLLQWWASIGGTFDACATELSDEFDEDRANRQCAAAKTEILGTRRWRGRF